MPASEFAPAKVNLFLHVGPPGADGYHPIASLMVFADVGDRLDLRSASEMSFRMTGPFAEDLAGEGENLVTRARDAVLAIAGHVKRPFELILEKALPVASGLGGGSADAAAALRLVAGEIGLAADLSGIAAGLGSDVPACLMGAPVVATGRGEKLGPPPKFPALDAVLVNPGIASPTASVYREYDRRPNPAGADPPVASSQFSSSRHIIDFLGECRNDLEDPAIRLAPAIGDVLARLRRAPQTLLARMSGSGATCFALCPGDATALDLERRLVELEPTWWVRRCRFGASR
ncbi:MAG TPA: 4-(cytidine 5'-diphospho)-2-C-methyl-D-erythritol kinase [Caulobacteraceae bacterium]